MHGHGSTYHFCRYQIAQQGDPSCGLFVQNSQFSIRLDQVFVQLNLIRNIQILAETC